MYALDEYVKQHNQCSSSKGSGGGGPFPKKSPTMEIQLIGETTAFIYSWLKS